MTIWNITLNKFWHNLISQTMNLEELFKDKLSKPKEKIEVISNWIKEKSLPTDELIAFAEKGKDPVKGSCIEALEFATKENPALADEAVFAFVTKSLAEKAGRIKWESAKVIGNTAHLFPSHLDTAITGLLVNAEDEGTVVRWSAAFALGEILKLKTNHNEKLLPAVHVLIEKEEKNSIKKIYLAAINKTEKPK